MPANVQNYYASSTNSEFPPKLSHVTLSLAGPWQLLPAPSEECVREGHSKEDQHKLSRLRNGGDRFRRSKNDRINRPFSAELISPRRRKKSRFMNSRTLPASQMVDAIPLASATFEKKGKSNNKLRTKVSEYDGNKYISESAATRNKALAAEYFAMLSGRNYLKKQYRENYWNHDAVVKSRVLSAKSQNGFRHATLYPDLGSVIGSAGVRKPHSDSSQIKYHQEFSGPWRLSSATSMQENYRTREASNLAFSSTADVSKTQESDDEGAITQNLRRSWSNISSGKCYRSLSQPNDTLASLSLEGRSASRTSTRTSSLSSSVSFSGLSDGIPNSNTVGDSVISRSLDFPASKSLHHISDENTQPKNIVFTRINITEDNNQFTRDSEQEISTVHGIPNSVFDDVDDLVRSCESEYEEDVEDDYEEDKVNKEIGYHVSYSEMELQESDISENEADDYEEDNVDENEFSRRLQQVNAAFDSSKPTHNSKEISVPVTITVEGNSDKDSDRSWEDEEHDSSEINGKKIYQFAEFLPKSFKDCDLSLFATLPNGMDWRSFVQFPKPRAHKFTDHSNRKTDLNKRKIERRIKERENKLQKSAEDMVDRLIMLEKMQGLTVQYEQDRRRHIMHRAKSRNSSRPATNNPNSTPRAVSPNTESQPTRPQSARPARRRSYSLVTTPTLLNQGNKPRKSVSNTELQIDASGDKPSHDIELIRLSCTKNHLQYIRHTSSNKRKQRFGITLPRYYEYSWSERLPPSKRPSINSLVYMKPRNCQSCRENEKKMAHLHVAQMMNNRPRSSYCTFSSEKLYPRPSTSVGSKTNNTSSLNSTTESRIRDNAKTKKNKEQSTSTKLPVPHGKMPTTFGHTPVKTAPRSAQEKILAANAILSSVVRDYTNAAKRGNRSNKRPSTSPSVRLSQRSNTNIIRGKQHAQVLKPHVVEYGNLRLR